jgi:hypothetical protein
MQLGLGLSTLAVTLLTLLLEGSSPQVPPNQFVRKRMQKFQKQPKNVKHRRSITNENVTHVKS